MKSAVACIPQAAAIPVRAGRICLVTSRTRNGWVIPKGRMEPEKTAAEIAVQEAWEEAGLTGVLHPEPVGSYLYQKWGNTYHVTVFLMHVNDVANEWPEDSQRQRRWLRPAEALRRVPEEGLRQIIRVARNRFELIG